MRFYGVTDIGKTRKQNQDKIYFPQSNDELRLFILADGMGGANAGDVASDIAIKSIIKYIKENFEKISHERAEIEKLINDSIINANDKIYSLASTDENLSGMGTTLTMVLIYRGVIYIGHIGDSRLYRFRKHIIRQLTKDHSYVQELLKQGTITKEEAANHPQKNALLKALGVEENVKPDIFEKGFVKEDVLLICSDGLTNMLEEKEIYEIINKTKNDLEKTCNELINKANEKGGLDNTSVIIISND